MGGYKMKRGQFKGVKKRPFDLALLEAVPKRIIGAYTEVNGGPYPVKAWDYDRWKNRFNDLPKVGKLVAVYEAQRALGMEHPQVIYYKQLLGIRPVKRLRKLLRGSTIHYYVEA